VSNAKQEEFPLKAGNRCKLQDKKVSDKRAAKQRITKKISGSAAK